MNFEPILYGPLFVRDAPDINLVASGADPVEVTVTVGGSSWPLPVTPVLKDGRYLAPLRMREILGSVVGIPGLAEAGEREVPLVTLTADGTLMSLRAVYGAAAGKTPAELAGHWLSWRDQISKTYAWGRERLTFLAGLDLLGWRSGTYSVKAKVYLASGNPVTVTLASGTLQAGCGYVTVDASYVAIAALVSGAIRAWDVSYSFSGRDSGNANVSLDGFPLRLVLAQQDVRVKEFVFCNSFGVEDRVYSSGRSNPKLEGASVAFLNGAVERELRNDATEGKEVFSGHLGSARESALWLDFLKAHERNILLSGGLARIVVDSQETDLQDNALGSVKFTYHLGILDAGRHFDDQEGLGEYDPSQRYGVLYVGDEPASEDLPTEDLFFLKTRLDEFPAADLDEDLLFLVQNPLTQAWGNASLNGIKEYLQRVITREDIRVWTGPWVDYSAGVAGYALSAGLGRDLYDRILNIETHLPGDLKSLTLNVGSETVGTYNPIGASDTTLTITADMIKAACGVLPYNHGGTGLSEYTKGDLIYASANNTLARLAANAGVTKKFLAMASSVPSWSSLAFDDLPDLYLGTTKIQRTSQAQALEGITTITASGQASVGSLKLSGGAPALTWDSTNNAWHLNGNMYVDGSLSAGGLSTTGGGGGIDPTAMWSLLAAPTGEPINASHINFPVISVAGQTGAVTSGQIASALNLGAAASYAVATTVSQGDTTHLVTGAAVHAAINSAVSSVLRFEGVSSTPITDGGTQTPTIGGVQVTPYKGMVVLYNAKEFVWGGSAWEELGDEASWALKTTTISAGTGLTGGGSLASNRTISLSQATQDSIALANSALQPSQIYGLTLKINKVGAADVTIGSYTPTSAASTLTISSQNIYDAIGSAKYHPYGGGESVAITASNITGKGNIILWNSDKSYRLTMNHIPDDITTARIYNYNGTDTYGDLILNSIIYCSGVSRVGIGGAAASGYRLDVTGNTRTSGKLYIGTSGAYFEYDSTNGVHLYVPSGKGFYTEGFVSAGGLSNSGSASGTDLETVWGSLVNGSPITPTTTTKIAAAHIPIGTGLDVDGYGNIYVTSPGSVTSVAGKTGAVTLVHSDLTDWATATAGFLTSAVTSLAGKAGAITIDTNSLSMSASKQLSVKADTFLPLVGGSMSNTNLVTNLNAEYLNGSNKAWYMKRGAAHTANNTTNLYLKVATVTITNTGTHDAGITLAVTSYGNYGNGILSLNYRKESGASTATSGMVFARWLARESRINPDDFTLSYKIVDANTSYVSLYVKESVAWKDYRFTMIDEGAWRGKTDLWELLTANGTTNTYASIPSDETQVASVDDSVASKMVTARTLWGRSFDGTANVSGDMTGVGNSTHANNTYLYWYNAPAEGETASSSLVLGMNANNTLLLGWGTAAAGYNTSIYGGLVTLAYFDGTTRNSGFVVGGAYGSAKVNYSYLDIIPSQNGQRNLGAAAMYWANTYSSKYYLTADLYFEVVNGNVHLHTPSGKGFYADGFISAGGLSDGGGSGGTTLAEVWISLEGNSGYGANKKIHTAHLPFATTSAAGAVIVGTGLSITNGVLSATNAGTITSVTKGTDVAGGAVTTNGGAVTIQFPSLSGYVPTTRTVNGKALSSNITLSLDDVADGSTRKLANYLPLTAGSNNTLTGALYISTPSIYSLYINSTGTSGAGLRFQVGGTTLGSLMTDASDNELYYNGNKVYHSGNANRNDVAWTCSQLNIVTPSGSSNSPYIYAEDKGNPVALVHLSSSGLSYSSRGNNAWIQRFSIDSSTGQASVVSLKLSGGAPTLTWDATNSAWHLSGSLYADGFISAGGLSPDSGTSGIDPLAMWKLLTNNDALTTYDDNTKIATAHIPDLSGTYVAKSGATMSGALTISKSGTDSLIINRTDNTPLITFKYNGTISGYIGVSSSSTPIFYDTTARTIYHSGNFVAGTNYMPMTGGRIASTSIYSLYLRNTAAGASNVGIRFEVGETIYGNLAVGSNGVLSYNGNTVYHAGNFTPGNYLPLAGGTMTLNSITDFTIKKTSNQYALICFRGLVDGTDTALGYLGIAGANNPVFVTSDSTYNTLLHARNYTSYVNTTNFPGLNKTGTVTSITLKAGSGIALDTDNTAITTSGTRTISLAKTYAGGTAVTLNGTSKAETTASFYAPISAGTSTAQLCVWDATNSRPTWITANKGSSTQPIYLNAGVPTACDLSSTYHPFGGGAYSFTASTITTPVLNLVSTGTPYIYVTQNNTACAYITCTTAGLTYNSRVDDAWKADFSIDASSGNIAMCPNRGSVVIGSSTGCNLYLKRPSVNYIWALTAGGILALGVQDSGSAGTATRTLVVNQYGIGVGKATGGVVASSTYALNVAGSTYISGGLAVAGNSVSFGNSSNCILYFNRPLVNYFIANKTGGYFVFRVNGSETNVMTLGTTGNLSVTGAVTAGAASDARLKTNINTMSDEQAKALIMALRPVTFTWNQKATELNDEYNGNDLGFVAQEVESAKGIIPGLSKAFGTIFTEYKRLDPVKFIAPIIKVEQDHERRIRELEKAIKARDEKIVELEKRLNMN